LFNTFLVTTWFHMFYFIVLTVASAASWNSLILQCRK
jgi:hypothetical protein